MNDRRKPMGLRPASNTKRIGRTGPETTPVRIRGLSKMGGNLEEYVRERIGFKLGKFADRVTMVSVGFVDHSGPKRAPTIACRVNATLVVGGTVTVEARHSTPRGAFDVAADAHERAVRRLLDRRGQARAGR